MALGLTVIGRVRQLFAARAPTPQELLHEIARWMDAAGLPAYEGSVLSGSGGSHALAVSLHPAAEPLTFTMPRNGVVVASAMTSAAGAGYHEYVCDLLQLAGRELAITWTTDGDTYRDATGYFDSADRSALEAQMLAWLGASLQRVRRLRAAAAAGPAGAAGAADLQLSLPPGVAFCHGAAVATPLGPRDDAWVERGAVEPEAALDALPWWEPGVGAPFLLNRALCRMWTQVYWRPPIDETEARTMRLAVDDLAAARALDSALPFPVAEWRELAALLGLEPPPASTAASPEAVAPAAPIGYRRGIARLDCGRWSLQLPGAFAFAADEAGLSGTDGVRSIRLSTIALPPGAPAGEQFLTAYRSRVVPAGGVPKRFATDSTVSEAALDRREGATVLRAHAIAGSRVAVIEMTLAGEADAGWALEAWRSIRFRGGA